MFDELTTQAEEHPPQPLRPAPPQPPSPPIQAEPPRKPARPWRFLDVLLVALVGVMTSAGVGIFGMLFWNWALGVNQNPGDEVVVLLLVMAMIFTAVFLSTLFTVRVLRGRPFSHLGFRKPSLQWILIGTFLGVIFIPIRISLVIILAVLFAPGQLTDSGGGGLFDFSNDAEPTVYGALLGLTAAFVLVVILAPLTEELIFRGVLYPWMRRRFGRILAITGSGFLFGLAHIDPLMVVSNTVLGWVLGASYEGSRSLWIPIWIHFVNNFLVAMMLGFLLVFIVLAGGI